MPVVGGIYTTMAVAVAAATATEMVVRATRRPHLLLLSRFSSFLTRSSSSRAVVSFVRASLLSPPPRKLPCFGTLGPLSLSLSPRHREGWREKSGPRIYSRGSCHFFSREGAIADRDHRFPLLVPLEFAHRLPRARARFIVLLPSPRPFRSLENCRDSLSRFLRRKEREYLP